MNDRDTPLISETPWARGIETPSRALLSQDGKAEELYRESIEHLARSRVTVHDARGSADLR